MQSNKMQPSETQTNPIQTIPPYHPYVKFVGGNMILMQEEMVITKTQTNIIQTSQQPIQPVVSQPLEKWQIELKEFMELVKKQGKLLEKNPLEDPNKVLLGSGAFGDVYRVLHNNKYFACKRLKYPNIMYSTVKYIIQEMKVMLEHCDKLTKDSHLLEISGIYFPHNYLETTDGICFLMPYLNGVSLEKFIDEMSVSGYASHQIVTIYLSILGDVIKGLVELEKDGIVHRDIKPENIFVEKQSTPEGKWKYTGYIIDYGFAKKVQNEINTSILGTKGYLPKNMNMYDLWQRDKFAYGHVILDLFICSIRGGALSTEDHELLSNCTNYGQIESRIGKELQFIDIFNSVPMLRKKILEIAIGCMHTFNSWTDILKNVENIAEMAHSISLTRLIKENRTNVNPYELMRTYLHILQEILFKACIYEYEYSTLGKNKIICFELDKIFIYQSTSRVNRGKQISIYVDNASFVYHGSDFWKNVRHMLAMIIYSMMIRRKDGEILSRENLKALSDCRTVQEIEGTFKNGGMCYDYIFNPTCKSRERILLLAAQCVQAQSNLSRDDIGNVLGFADGDINDAKSMHRQLLAVMHVNLPLAKYLENN